MAGAASLLTVVRVGARSPGPDAVPAFPVVGAALGAAVGAVWWSGDRWWGLAVAASLAVLADLVLTGLLHVDGLADCGDGLLAPLPRDRRLAAMSDPHIGAFGAATLVAVLLVRFSALASVGPRPLALAGIWATSRLVMAVTLTLRTHARPDGGLGGALRQGDDRLTLAIGIPIGVVAGVVGAGLAGLVAVAATAAAAAAVVGLAERRIGGWTGDVLGAAGVVGETAGLLVLAAAW